jgi:hypothetical protein
LFGGSILERRLAKHIPPRHCVQGASLIPPLHERHVQQDQSANKDAMKQVLGVFALEAERGVLAWRPDGSGTSSGLVSWSDVAT